jgi:hypothetical protein
MSLCRVKQEARGASDREWWLISWEGRSSDGGKNGNKVMTCYGIWKISCDVRSREEFLMTFRF